MRQPTYPQRLRAAGLEVLCILYVSALSAGAAVTEQTLPAVWQVKLDPANAGLAEKWFSPEFKEVGWTPISTHKWRGWDKQGMPEHVGYAWYRVRWKAPRTPRKKFVYLYFGAVDEQAWVYLNGKLVGQHTCASTGKEALELWNERFLVDVTETMKPGQVNLLTVRVLNGRMAGGIWKPIRLIAAK